MPLTLVNPLNESAAAAANPAARLDALAGKTLALLDISKPGGNVFLDRVERILTDRYAVGRVIRAMKPTFAKPAPPDVIAAIRGADAVIEALAD